MLNKKNLMALKFCRYGFTHATRCGKPTNADNVRQRTDNGKAFTLNSTYRRQKGRVFKQSPVLASANPLPFRLRHVVNQPSQLE
jgi:hypothetical protein